MKYFAKDQALYEYLQSTTRYVNIQLGIGSWQPFDATYVHTRGYGDCKALSNYMIAMLQAAGVEAYPVLIRHGEEAPEVLADFPSNQFNHMIACAKLWRTAHRASAKIGCVTPSTSAAFK